MWIVTGVLSCILIGIGDRVGVQVGTAGAGGAQVQEGV